MHEGRLLAVSLNPARRVLSRMDATLPRTSASIRKVLVHLGLPLEPPDGATTRGPPEDDRCAYDVA
jgi:hypothetical protein